MAGRFNDCVKALWKGSDSGKRWNEKEATDFANAMEGKVPGKAATAEIIKNSPQEMKDLYEKAAQEHIKETILQTKLARVRDTLTKQKLDSAVSLANSYKNPREFIRSFLSGTQKVRQEGRGGVDAAIKSNTEWVLNGFRQDLDKIDTGISSDTVWGKLRGKDATAMDLLLKGDLDERILQKKHVLDGGDTPLPKSTGLHDEVADKVAESYHKWNNYLVDRQNAQGAGIAKLQGRGTGQWNNTATMEHGGYEKWANFIKPLLDDRTFGFADKDKFLKSSYSALTTSMRLARSGDVESAAKSFSTNDLAGSAMNKERVFHFKDPSTQLKYLQSEYSHGGMAPAILKDLTSGIKNATLYEHMGTDPEKFYSELVSRLKDQGRRELDNVGDKHGMDSKEYKVAAKSLKKLQGQDADSSYTKNILRNITGYNSFDVNPTASSIVNGWKTWMTSLTQTASLYKVFPDLLEGPAEAISRGTPYLQAHARYWAGMMEGLTKGLTGAEKAEEYMHVQAFSEEMGKHLATQKLDHIGGIKGLFTNDNFPISEKINAFANAANRFIFDKVNMIQHWDEWLMQASRTTATRMFGEYAHLPFEELPNAGFKRSLNSYGIGKPEWETLRQGVFDGAPGKRAVTGDSVFNLPDSVFKNYLESQEKGASDYQIARAKSELGTLINKYIYHAGYQTIMHPDAATRATTNIGGYQKGTPGRIVNEIFFQLKGFSIQNFRTSTGRALYGGGADSLPEALKSGTSYGMMANKLVQGAILSMIGTTAGAYAMGKTPPDFTHPAQAFETIARGGGLGLYAEFLTSRYDHSYGPANAILGPTGNFLSKGIILGSESAYNAVEGKKQPTLQAFKFAVDAIPGMKAPLVRPLMNYMILDRLKNSISPGSVQKQNRHIEKETGSKPLSFLQTSDNSSKK